MPAVNRNLNRRISNILYMLKRQYGGCFDFYRRGPSGTTNYLTGEVVVDKEVFNINRGIILPAKIMREATQNISIISANKAFVYGGTYDSSVRMFIVDRKDIPELNLKDFDPTPDDWLVYENRKYEIKSFQEFEFDSAWVFIGKAVLGDVPEQIFKRCADNLLQVGQQLNNL